MFHPFHSLLEVAENDLLNIEPSLFKDAVYVEPDGFNTHVAHHHLVRPLIHNGL